jgi:NAD(P)-dependent dehydrogenase (short-subunit alcohol dehydrogenase family)
MTVNGVHHQENFMNKAIVVTGTSTGIGWGIADVLIRKGLHVFGTVRSKADGERLQSEFGSAFIPLVVDVTDQSSIKLAVERVSGILGRSKLAGLINNAGIAIVGPLLHLPLGDFRRQLEVNLTAPFQVTQAFAPLLGADRTRVGEAGRIVNISSVGGKMGVPFLGAYVASKHGLEGMSESLRRELLIYGIDVILIEPGSVNTAIWDKAETEDYASYRQTDYVSILETFRKAFIEDGRKGLAPADIGELVYSALTTPKPSVSYTVLRQKFTKWTLPNLLPKRIVDRLIGRRLGLLPIAS